MVLKPRSGTPNRLAQRGRMNAAGMAIRSAREELGAVSRRKEVYRTDVEFTGEDRVVRTPEQIAELVDRIREARRAEPAVTQAEIGRRLGVTGGYVSWLMKKNGIPGRAVYGGTGAVPVGQSREDRLARLDAWEKEHGPYKEGGRL